MLPSLFAVHYCRPQLKLGGCFIEHPEALAPYEAAGAPVSEAVTDVTPEGMRFSEAMITSPAGHAILVYELSNAP